LVAATGTPGGPKFIARSLAMVVRKKIMKSPSSGGGLIIPNYDEFLEGRPYLILGDSSIVFSAKPLA
jgi:hypothetical protein